MKRIKSFFSWVCFFLFGTGKKKDEAVENGILDFSGQGKDRYGK